MYDVVIIGGGPIGIFSVFACGLEGLSVALFDSNKELGGQCKFQYASKKIYDIPAHPVITGGELIDQLILQSSIFKPKIFLESFVTQIDEVDNGFIVHSSNGDVEAKAIIVALGAGIYQPVKLSVPFDRELEGGQIHYKVEDPSLFENKDIAVLGGGDSALDWALELSEVAHKVFLVHRREKFNGSIYSVQKLKNHSNVVKKTPFSLQKIEKNDDKLMLFSENDSLKVDHVLPFYGSITNIGFLNEWGLSTKESKILVEAGSLATSRKGIYAVGDCITYEGKRNLIATGFAESMMCSRAIFKYLNPQKACAMGHSTSNSLFQ